MLSNDRKSIMLMNPVRIDYRLMKHMKEKESEPSGNVVNIEMSDGMTTMGGSDSGFGNWSSKNIWDGVPFSVQRQFRSPVMRKVMEYYIRFRLLFDKPTKDPAELFAEVKHNFKDLESSDAEMEKIVKLLKSLERTKQLAASKSVLTKKAIITAETKLYNAKIRQYQTEASLIKFIKKCKKGLCLVEIENFENVIPTEVVDKITKAEELKVFDNYYILYYDPSGAKNIHLTTEPDDPIVFGVIRNSDKLYYIADWIDEYCNLTYKDIIEKGIDFKLEPQKEEV